MAWVKSMSARRFCGSVGYTAAALFVQCAGAARGASLAVCDRLGVVTAAGVAVNLHQTGWCCAGFCCDPRGGAAGLSGDVSDDRDTCLHFRRW